MKVTIKGIEIEINGELVVLTIEDAKQLQQELTALLGEKTTPVPHYVPVPCYPEPSIYYPPLITVCSRIPTPPLPVTTCGTTIK